MAQETTTWIERFPLGLILMTRGVRELVEAGVVDTTALLGRHASGDWGEIAPEDSGLNERALRTGARLFSVYEVAPDTTVWLITEAEDHNGYRHATTALLPSEY